MPSIDVTELIARMQADGLSEYSASIAEISPDAARITWKNCLSLAEDFPDILAGDNLTEWKTDVADWGAWDESEIGQWDRRETIALFIQFVAGDYREFKRYCEGDWDNYRECAEFGTVKGNLSPTLDKFGEAIRIDYYF